MSDHILLKWKKETPHEVREGAKRANSMKRVPSTEWGRVGIELYELPPGLAKKSVEWLIEKGFVENAEVDGEGEGIPIDPDVGEAMSIATLSQGAAWYQQRVGLPAAWSEADGTGRKLGVCDSGANHAHEWLKDSIVVSKNFVANETTTHDNEGHGTACAGITKAIARGSKLVIARVMSMNSAKWSALGAGIIWCADQGCTAINVSIGGPSDSWSLQSAIAYANSKSCPPIVAAGNAGSQTVSYPAGTAGAIAVSATDQGDNKAGFSQYGSHITIAAPGVGLLTSWGGGYNSFSGTSGSAPVVTGCVGVVAARYNMSGQDALQVLVLSARDLNNALFFGAGIPDLVKALSYGPGTPVPEPDPTPEPPPPVPPTTIPSTPTDLEASNVTPTGYDLTWSPPDAGRRTGYEIQQGGIKAGNSKTNSFRFTVTNAKHGISPGTLHSCKVAAFDQDTSRFSLWSEFLVTPIPTTGTPPPPPPPPPPPKNAVEPEITAIEAAWPTLSAADRTNTKSRIAALPN